MEIIIKCVDCGKEIILTEGEQEFYKKNKFPYPKRCKECRELLKLKRIEKSKRKIDNERE